MQETWVQSLVQEGPTCLGATKPVLLNLCSRVQELKLLSRHAALVQALLPKSPYSAAREAAAPRGPSPTTGGWSPIAAAGESPSSSEDPAQPKINNFFF